MVSKPPPAAWFFHWLSRSDFSGGEAKIHDVPCPLRSWVGLDLYPSLRTDHVHWRLTPKCSVRAQHLHFHNDSGPFAGIAMALAYLAWLVGLP